MERREEEWIKMWKRKSEKCEKLKTRSESLAVVTMATACCLAQRQQGIKPPPCVCCWRSSCWRSSIMQMKSCSQRRRPCAAAGGDAAQLLASIQQKHLKKKHFNYQNDAKAFLRTAAMHAGKVSQQTGSIFRYQKIIDHILVKISTKSAADSIRLTFTVFILSK